jgi:hypothetical protein
MLPAFTFPYLAARVPAGAEWCDTGAEPASPEVDVGASLRQKARRRDVARLFSMP